MARPQKHTVEYFSHDANASSSKTLIILENCFGTDGYAGWFKLLETLAGTENHVIGVGNSMDIEYLAARLHLKTDKTKLILDKLAELEAIDRELYAQGYIWCQNFVDRLKVLYDKRQDKQLPQRPNPRNNLHTDPRQNHQNIVSDTDNSVIDTGNPITDTDNHQTKLKETKLNKTKVNKREKTLTKKSYGQFGNVLLNDDQVTKLKEKFNGHYDEKLEYFSEKKSAHGYKYESDYAAILNWAREDEKKAAGNSGGHYPSGDAAVDNGQKWKDFQKGGATNE
jgi:hypothetical protein